MATHSSIPAWRIPWTEEPGGLQSMDSQRAGHHWACNACTHIIYSHHAVCFITTHGPFSHLLQASHMLTSSQHYTICFSNSGSLTLSSLPHQATRWGNCPFLPVFIPRPKLFAYTHLTQFSSVQLLSCVWLFATPWTAARQASLSITNSRSLPKLMSIELMMPSNHFILCRPLLLLPSIFPNIKVFSNESALCIRWPKFWSFSFNFSPSNEHPGLISFRMDWLDLLAVQGTLKSLLQHHSSKASVLWHSAFFIVQLSHPYMTIGKTIALTRWAFCWQK